MRVGILTGGGDCPGLNAVIRAAAKTLFTGGVEVLGFGTVIVELLRKIGCPLTRERYLGFYIEGEQSWERTTAITPSTFR